MCCLRGPGLIVIWGFCLFWLQFHLDYLLVHSSLPERYQNKTFRVDTLLQILTTSVYLDMPAARNLPGRYHLRSNLVDLSTQRANTGHREGRCMIWHESRLLITLFVDTSL